MAYDMVIKGALVVDGTGRQAFRGDVAVQDGASPPWARSTARLRAPSMRRASSSLRASSTPTPTTDAQLLWDPSANPAIEHGVTTILMGNCGYTLAPVRSQDQDYLMGLFAAAEEVPKKALQLQAPFGWETFPDYLADLDRGGRLGLNVLTQVGHSAVRRYVMGKDALEREASDAEIAEMVRIVEEAMDAGARGREQQPGSPPGRRVRRAHPLLLLVPGRARGVGGSGPAQGQAPGHHQPGQQARWPGRGGPRAARQARRGLRRGGVLERLRDGNAQRGERPRVHGGRAPARSRDLRRGPLPAAGDALHPEEAVGDLRRLRALARLLPARSAGQDRGTARPHLARATGRILEGGPLHVDGLGREGHQRVDQAPGGPAADRDRRGARGESRRGHVRRGRRGRAADLLPHLRPGETSTSRSWSGSSRARPPWSVSPTAEPTCRPSREGTTPATSCSTGSGRRRASPWRKAWPH